MGLYKNIYWGTSTELTAIRLQGMVNNDLSAKEISNSVPQGLLFFREINDMVDIGEKKAPSLLFETPSVVALTNRVLAVGAFIPATVSVKAAGANVTMPIVAQFDHYSASSDTLTTTLRTYKQSMHNSSTIDKYHGSFMYENTYDVAEGVHTFTLHVYIRSASSLDKVSLDGISVSPIQCYVRDLGVSVS